jgi:hypothetical protein
LQLIQPTGVLVLVVGAPTTRVLESADGIEARSGEGDMGTLRRKASHGMLRALGAATAVLWIWTGGLAHPATAQSGQAPQAADPKAWDTYLREAYGARQVQLPEGLDGPFLIVGDLAPPIGGADIPLRELKAAAGAFIANNLGLFGLREPTGLRYSHTTRDRSGRRYLTYQRYRGALHLDRMEVVFHFQPDGAMFAVGGTLRHVESATVPSGEAPIDSEAPTLRVSPSSVSVTQTANRPIFIELDYMVGADHTHAPMAGVIDKIKQTFAAAGYAAHIEVDDALPHTAVIPITTAGVAGSPWIQNLITTNFDHRDDSRWYYAIWGHNYSNDGALTSSSGVADLPGRVHLVTLGSFTGQTGTFSNQVGTAIHEFGHNIGQRHGGADHDNWKPNYLSVMNYHYQLEGIGPTLLAKNWVYIPISLQDFSYSHGLTRYLNESSLDEWFGVGFARAIDWNCRDSFTTGVSQDLQASNPCLATGTKSYIYDFDNWTDLASQVRLGPGVETLWSEPCVTREESLETEALVRALRERGELPPEPDGAALLQKDGAAPEPTAPAGKSLVVYNDGATELNVRVSMSPGVPWLSWHPGTTTLTHIPAGGSQGLQLYFDFSKAPNGTSATTLYFTKTDLTEQVAVPISITTNRPGNDNCAGAPTITTSPYSYSADITQATTSGDPVPSCGNGSREKSVWFQYTPAYDGTVVADTIGTNFDTILSVWTGACGAVTAASCDDDSGGSLTSRISMAVSAGVPYKFMVSAYRGEGGTLRFHLQYTPATRRLILGTGGTGTGTVAPSPPGISCGTNCWDYPGTPVVTLLQSPAAGSVFAGWTGADADCLDGVVTMTANRSCTGNFGLVPLEPNLAITGLAGPGGAPSGGNYTVKDTTANLGAGPATSSWTRFHLSTNATLDYDDPVIGSRLVPALVPGGASGPIASVLSIPSVPPGKYYLLAFADSAEVVRESNEGDNLRRKVLYVGPDLLIKTIVAPASAAPGSTVSFTVTTRNTGKNPTAATVAKLFYSADGSLGPGDVELATRAVPGLAVSGTDTWTGTALIPAGALAGTRYLIAVADYFNAQDESKETNNTKKATFTVTP